MRMCARELSIQYSYTEETNNSNNNTHKPSLPTVVSKAHADVPGIRLVGGAVVNHYGVKQALAAHLLHYG